MISEGASIALLDVVKSGEVALLEYVLAAP
jgi:hypothetical protein